jgi:hypothetical protein
LKQTHSTKNATHAPAVAPTHTDHTDHGHGHGHDTGHAKVASDSVTVEGTGFDDAPPQGESPYYEAGSWILDPATGPTAMDFLVWASYHPIETSTIPAPFLAATDSECLSVMADWTAQHDAIIASNEPVIVVGGGGGDLSGDAPGEGDFDFGGYGNDSPIGPDDTIPLYLLHGTPYTPTPYTPYVPVDPPTVSDPEHGIYVGVVWSSYDPDTGILTILYDSPDQTPYVPPYNPYENGSYNFGGGGGDYNGPDYSDVGGDTVEVVGTPAPPQHHGFINVA